MCTEQLLIRSHPGGRLSAGVLPVLTGWPTGTHPLPVLSVGAAGPALWVLSSGPVPRCGPPGSMVIWCVDQPGRPTPAQRCINEACATIVRPAPLSPPDTAPRRRSSTLVHCCWSPAAATTAAVSGASIKNQLALVVSLLAEAVVAAGGGHGKLCRPPAATILPGRRAMGGRGDARIVRRIAMDSF